MQNRTVLIGVVLLAVLLVLLLFNSESGNTAESTRSNNRARQQLPAERSSSLKGVASPSSLEPKHAQQQQPQAAVVVRTERVRQGQHLWNREVVMERTQQHPKGGQSGGGGGGGDHSSTANLPKHDDPVLISESTANRKKHHRVVVRGRHDIRVDDEDDASPATDGSSSAADAAAAPTSDDDEILFHIHGHLVRPDKREFKAKTLKQKISVDELYTFKKSLYTWFYLFDEQPASARALPLLGVTCSNSASFENRDNKEAVSSTDCGHVLNMLGSLRAPLGHLIIIVISSLSSSSSSTTSGNTSEGNSSTMAMNDGDQDWVNVFLELEASFPARITLYHHRKDSSSGGGDVGVGNNRQPTCGSAWLQIARLGFKKLRPRVDSLLIVSPNFRSSRDELQRFAQFARAGSASLMARFVEEPQRMSGAAAAAAASGENQESCYCTAIFMMREAYFHLHENLDQKDKQRARERFERLDCPEAENTWFDGIKLFPDSSKTYLKLESDVKDVSGGFAGRPPARRADGSKTISREEGYRTHCLC